MGRAPSNFGDNLDQVVPFNHLQLAFIFSMGNVGSRPDFLAKLYGEKERGVVKGIGETWVEQ